MKISLFFKVIKYVRKSLSCVLLGRVYIRIRVWRILVNGYIVERCFNMFKIFIDIKLGIRNIISEWDVMCISYIFVVVIRYMVKLRIEKVLFGWWF